MSTPSSSSPSPASARQAWGSLEVLHGLSYLAPEIVQSYRDLDVLHGRRGYFAARSAPMGMVPPGVVTAAFFVFAPDLVAKAIPSVWEAVTPRQILQVRRDSTAAALTRILGDLRSGGAVAEAAELAREACSGLAPHGRPMFAALDSLAWPDEPILQLWHAGGLLREHRGDGHIAALILNGLDPVEALQLNGAALGATDFVRTTRGWTEEQWADGTERLTARELLADGELTTSGRALYQQIEQQTDRAAMAGWDRLGTVRTDRLIHLLAPLRAAVLDSGALPGWMAERGAPSPAAR